MLKVNDHFYSKNIKIDEDRLIAELPLLMLYSLSYAGGSKAPHEVFNDISNDINLQKLFREISKISKIYIRFVKKYGNSIFALERTADVVASVTFSRLIRSYIASYVLRGSPLETLYQIAVISAEMFEQKLRDKLEALMHGIELIATATVVVLMTVILSSSLSANYVASYIASLIVIGFSFAIAVSTRIRVLSVLMPRDKPILLDLLSSLTVITSLILLLIDKYLYAIALSTLTIPLYIYNIAVMKSIIARLSRLTYTVRVITDALALRLTNIDIVISIIKHGEGPERPLIYALRTGRAAPGNIEKWHLVYLLSKTISAIVRSGSNASKVARIANTILESISLNMRILFNKAIAIMVLLSAIMVTITVSIAYAAHVFNSTSAIATSPLGSTFFITINKELAVKSIAVTGVGASFAITYTVWGSLAYNIAAPLIVIGTSIIMLLL